MNNKNESISKTLIKFSLPLIFSGVLQQLYNWADAFIVGNVEGEGALAAIGATTGVVNFFIMAITGFTLGLSIIIAQKYGRNEKEDIVKILSTFSLIMGIVFIALSVMGIILCMPILRIMNTTRDTISLANEYLSCVFVGVPFLAVYNVYSAVLRGIGNSRAPFLAVLLSSAVNIILDIIFVVFLKMGVMGAAVATVISQIAMTIFLIIYTVKKHKILIYKINKSAIDFKSIGLGLHFGIPPMIQSSISAFGYLILQNFMNGFGTVTVAAITTAYRIDTMLLLPIVNLSSAISTMSAHSFGAKGKKEAFKVLKAGAVLMVIVSAILTVFIITMGGRLIGLFGVSEAAMKIGQAFFIRLGSFYVIYGIAMSIRGYIEGIGDVAFSSIIGVIALIIRIAVSYIFADVGNMIIAYAESFAWCVMLAMYLIRLKKCLNSNNM